MLLTNHVLSGALIGARAPGPVSAFAAGFGSHFVLDAVPHWGEWGSQRKFLRVARVDGLVSLGVMAAFAAAALTRLRRRPARYSGSGQRKPISAARSLRVISNIGAGSASAKRM